VVVRLDRNRALPEASQPRVEDPSTQRALSAIFNSLREVVKYLQPFVQPSKWRALPSYDDWGRGSTNNKLAQYRIDPLKYVELRGEAKTVNAASTTIGVLPVGSRPYVNMTFPVTVFDVTIKPGRVDVQTSGNVVLVDPAVARDIEVYLDGIRFSPEE